MTLAGSTLYGTTFEGGASNTGTVFSLPVGGGSPTTLASFTGSNGYYPCGALTLSGNTLYGTTNTGGANYDGTVFSVPLSGGSPTVLASFSGSNGKYPRGDLTLSGSTLYGTTSDGGAYNDGTVFSVPRERWQPHGAGLVQRQQRRQSARRLDAQRQHPVRDDRRGGTITGTARSLASP